MNIQETILLRFKVYKEPLFFNWISYRPFYQMLKEETLPF